MSNLSEKEIIKDLNKYISFASKSENFSNDNDFKWNVNLSQRIEGLLDLYNKEKAKLTEYKKQLDLDYVEENYISKDKIEEIRDKAECLDYYNFVDLINDLNTLLGEEE